jgi:hypothetical protein
MMSVSLASSTGGGAVTGPSSIGWSPLDMSTSVAAELEEVGEVEVALRVAMGEGDPPEDA